MEEYITPDRIANAIMQDNNFKGYYLIVEGIKDSKLFQKYINHDNFRIREGFGNEKVKQALDILSERGFDRKLGIIDSDFNQILGIDEKKDGLFITDDHDIEIMIIKTKALEIVITLFCNKQKISEFERKIGMTVRDALFNLGTEIGYLKLANKIHDLGLIFKPKEADGNQIKYKNFIDEATLKFLGDEKLVETVVNYCRNKSPNLKETPIIIESLKAQKKEKQDIYHLTNGHDLTNILYLFLKKTLASKNKMLVDTNSVEDSLILALELDDFKNTKLYKDLFEWHTKNGNILFS
jgi:hypothetical protein